MRAEARATGPALGELARQGVIPVLRFRSAEEALDAAGALYEAGFRVLELTMTVPGATELLPVLAERHPDALVGAGTVLSTAEAERSLAAGARFLVSPCRVAGLADLCREAGAACLTGALTPSEVLAAWDEGVTAVKVFPAASVGGPAHVKALRSVMPHVPLVPTGGVTLASVPEYLAAGAAAVGVGGELFDRSALREGRRADAVAHARAFLEAARRAQGAA